MKFVLAALAMSALVLAGCTKNEEAPAVEAVAAPAVAPAEAAPLTPADAVPVTDAPAAK